MKTTLRNSLILLAPFFGLQACDDDAGGNDPPPDSGDLQEDAAILGDATQVDAADVDSGDATTDAGDGATEEDVPPLTVYKLSSISTLHAVKFEDTLTIQVQYTKDRMLVDGHTITARMMEGDKDVTDTGSNGTKLDKSSEETNDSGIATFTLHAGQAATEVTIVFDDGPDAAEPLEYKVKVAADVQPVFELSLVNVVNQEHPERPAQNLLYKETLTFELKYTKDGEPLRDQAIHARLLEYKEVNGVLDYYPVEQNIATGNTSLAPASASTSAEGIVKFKLSAGTADTSVMIEFDDDEEFSESHQAKPYRHPVDITSASKATIKATVTYATAVSALAADNRYSAADLKAVELKVTETCDTRHTDVRDNIWAHVESEPFTGGSKTITFTGRGLDGRPGAVSAFLKGERGVILAETCKPDVDIQRGIDNNDPVIVDDLKPVDLPLNFKQYYNSEQRLNILGVLKNYQNTAASTTGKVIDGVGRIAGANANSCNVSGTFEIDVIDENGNQVYDEEGNPVKETYTGDCCRGKAALDLIVEYVDVEGFIREKISNETVADVAVAAAVGMIQSDDLACTLQGFVNKLPNGVIKVLDGIGDVYEIISDLHVFGSLNFPQQIPNSDKLLQTNTNIWDRLTFHWENACNNKDDPDAEAACAAACTDNDEETLCAKEKTFTFKELGITEVLKSDFDARLEDGKKGTADDPNNEYPDVPYMALGDHNMKIVYGKLAVGALERWVIPFFMRNKYQNASGQMCEQITFKQFFQSWLPCNWFADKVYGWLGDKCITVFVSICASDFISRESLYDLCYETATSKVGDGLEGALNDLNEHLPALKLNGHAVYQDRLPDLQVDTLKDGTLSATFPICQKDEDGNEIDQDGDGKCDTSEIEFDVCVKNDQGQPIDANGNVVTDENGRPVEDLTRCQTRKATSEAGTIRACRKICDANGANCVTDGDCAFTVPPSQGELNPDHTCTAVVTETSND